MNLSSLTRRSMRNCRSRERVYGCLATTMNPQNNHLVVWLTIVFYVVLLFGALRTKGIVGERKLSDHEDELRIIWYAIQALTLLMVVAIAAVKCRFICTYDDEDFDASTISSFAETPLEDILPQGKILWKDEFPNPKAYAKSMWKHREENKRQAKRKREEQLEREFEERDKAKRRMLSMRGRLKPEGDSDDDDPPSLLRRFAWGSEATVYKGPAKKELLEPDGKKTQVEKLEQTFSKLLAGRVTSYPALSTRLVVYITSLMTCTSMSNFIALSAQAAVGMMSDDLVVKFQHLVMTMIVPQAEEKDWKGGLKSFLTKTKGQLVAVSSIPIVKQFIRVISLMLMFGIKPPKLDMPDSAMKMWYDNYVESLMKGINAFDIPLLLIDVFDFCLEFWIRVSNGGDMGYFFRPSSLMGEASKLVAMKDRWKAGQLEEAYNMDEYEYMEQVSTCIQKINDAIARKGISSTDLNIMTRLNYQLTEILACMHVQTACGKIRAAPPVISLFAESQIGKTGIAYFLIHCIGKWLDFPTEDKNIWQPNKASEREDGYNNMKKVIFCDDEASTLPEYDPRAFSDFILQCANTVPTPTNQAELANKGNIFFRPKLVMATTNTYHLNYHAKSMYGKASANRTIFIMAEVDPEFQLPNGGVDHAKVVERFGDNLQMGHILFTLYTLDYGDAGKGCKPMPKVVPKMKIDLTEKNLRFHDFMKALKKRVMKHHEEKNQYVQMIERMRSAKFCDKCGIPRYMCNCPYEEVTPEAEEVVSTDEVATLWSILTHTESFFNAMCWLNPIYFMSEDIIAWFGNIMYPHICVKSTELLQYLMLKCFVFLAKMGTRMIPLVIWLSIPILGFIYCVYDPMFMVLLRIILVIWFFLTWLFLRRIQKIIGQILVKTAIDSKFSACRELRALQLGGCVITMLSSVFAFRSMYYAVATSWKPLSPEGQLMPETKEELEERSSEKNMWVNVKPDMHLYSDHELDTSTLEQVRSVVSSNVVSIAGSTDDGKGKRSNALMLESGLVLVPKHHHLSAKYPVTIKASADLGRQCTCYIEKIVDVNCGAQLLLLSKRMTFNNITKLFLKEHAHSTDVCMMLTRHYQDDSYEIVERSLRWEYDTKVTNSVEKGMGSYYRCSEKTSDGDCMSPIVRCSPPYAVIGYHCGGTNSGTIQAGFALSKKELDAALQQVRMVAEGETFLPQPEQKPPSFTTKTRTWLNPKPEYHERDCMLYVQNNDAHGMVPMGCDQKRRISKAYSTVRPSILSVELAKLGRPSAFCAVRFNINRQMADHISNSQNMQMDVIPAYLESSIGDFLHPILAHIAKTGQTARPYDLDVAINGLEGDRFAKQLNMKTSAGPGLPGGKTRYFDLVSEFPHRYKLEPELVDELNRIVATRRQRISVPMVAVACLKDEPRPLNKADKARAFYVHQMVNVLHGRMILLPILRFMKQHPLLCEQAVGINCTNDEWDQLGRHIFKYKYCIEGDFSKWDLTISGQLARAASVVFVEIARALGYTPAELDELSTWLHDASKCVKIINGSVVWLDGTISSGEPDTVEKNGIAVSLDLRIVFLMLWNQHESGDPPAFRECVALTTNGDDHGGTTTKEWFNLYNISSVFQSLGVKWTSASKGEITSKFVRKEDFTFLKRRFRYEEQVQMYCAPIDLDSVYRSIHCNFESKEDYREIVVQNVTSAFRELARHEREVFDREVAIIRQACENAGIAHLVPHFDWSWDDWWSDFKVRYYGYPDPSQQTQSDWPISITEAPQTYENFDERMADLFDFNVPTARAARQLDTDL